MPRLLIDLAGLINRLPVQKDAPDLWKRLRIAVTEEEIEQFKEFYRHDTTRVVAGRENVKEFVWAIRGVPLVLELHPTDPMYLLERLNAIPQRPPID